MLDTLLRLSVKRLLLIVAAWVICVLMHNVIYALFQDFFGPRGDEPFFLIFAVIIFPAYFVASLAYTIIQRLRKRGD